MSAGLSRSFVASARQPAVTWAPRPRVKERLARIPGGAAVSRAISRAKARVKGFVLPTSLFEQMGFTYLGPVDGHDLKSVCELLAQAKKMKKPVLLHVMTQKGRGYAPSEQEPEKYHGVFAASTRVTGRLRCGRGRMDFSALFSERSCAVLCGQGRDASARSRRRCLRARVWDQFASRFPTRFFDVGIAEEHAVAMAAGVAAQGLVPVVALYSTFLTACLRPDRA